MLDHIRRNGSEAATVAALMIVFLGVVIGGFQLRPAPGLFPRIVGIAGVVVTLLVALRFLQGAADLDEEDGLLANPPRRRAVALVSPLVYGALFYLFGFYVSAGVTIAAVPWLLGYRRPVFLVLLALGTIVFLDLMFTVLLDVPIPLGVVGDWYMRRFVYTD